MSAVGVLRRTADKLDPPPSPYLADPEGWVDAKTGEHLWSKQRHICRSVVSHRRTAVRSCHGVGKDFTAARLAGWWIDVHPPGTAFVVTTAPTDPQVKAILWKEIGRVWRKGKLRGRITLDAQWKLDMGSGPDELVAFGRKPADYDPAAFQGIHARYVLVIIDEACGIPEELWIAAGALATNDDCRILAIGNPDDPTSHFAKVCQPGTTWNVIHISAFDSPNFTDEEVPSSLRPMLISQIYLDELAEDAGEDSPAWQSKVLGEFPADTEDSVVPASKVLACRRPEQQHTADELLPVELGVDVGGSDDGDMTVIRERTGCKAGRVARMASSESEKVAAAVLRAIIETGATRAKIDSIGVGWGVAGQLQSWRDEGRHNCEIVKVNVGSRSTEPKRFPKLRDQIWWEVGRLMSTEGRWDLETVDDRTVADLTAPRWAPDTAGRVKVEPKADTKKRLGRSPDDADALLLAFYAGQPRKRTMRYAA